MIIRTMYLICALSFVSSLKAQQIITLKDSVVVNYKIKNGKKIKLFNNTTYKRAITSSQDIFSMLYNYFGNKNYRKNNEFSIQENYHEAYVVNNNDATLPHDTITSIISLVKFPKTVKTALDTGFVETLPPTSKMPLNTFITSIDPYQLLIVTTRARSSANSVLSSIKKQNTTIFLNWIKTHHNELKNQRW